MRRGIFALAGLLATLPAGAHLMPPGQGAVRFDTAGAFAMVALPATAFTGFDTDGNGRISPAEYQRARDDLQRQLPQVLQLRNGGEPGRVLVNQLLLPGVHELGSAPDSDHLVAMLRVVWDAPPNDVTLRAAWLEKGGGPLQVQAARDGETEAVVLAAGHAEHRFFAGPVEAFLRSAGFGAPAALLAGVALAIGLALGAMRWWKRRARATAPTRSPPPSAPRPPSPASAPLRAATRRR